MLSVLPQAHQCLAIPLFRSSAQLIEQRLIEAVERFFPESESSRRCRVMGLLLQSVLRSRIAALHARNGSRRHGSHLDDWGANRCRARAD